MRKVKYAVIKETTEEMFVIIQDGGVASCYNNGEHLISEYYRERLTKDALIKIEKFQTLEEDDEIGSEYEQIWSFLGEGEMYAKDWDGSDEESPLKQEWDEEVIEDMLNWLYISTDAIEFERVELDWDNEQDKKDFITEED